MRSKTAVDRGLSRRPSLRTAGGDGFGPGGFLGTVLALLLLSGPAGAQTTSSSILERLQQLQAPDRGATQEMAIPAPSTPLETLIDPDSYRLFSGDQLHLGVWGEIPRTYLLAVEPEGDIILPGLGPLRVAGLTLSQAEASAIEALRPIHGRARITLRLIQAARFRVMVTGMVSKPGIYEMTGADRLSSLLEQAGGIRADGSLRRILVRPPDVATGSTTPAQLDMLPWLLRGEIQSNPFLEPGQRIEVPAQGATVRIRGPVLSRGPLQAPELPAVRIGDRPEEEPDLVVEIRDGDTVGTLLDQVGGLSDRSTGRGTLQRGSEPPRTLDLASAEGRAVPLQAGDLLEVEYARRWVFVTGSVRSPGRFPFLPGLEARDYVYLAGGPTEVGRSSGWTVEVPGRKRQDVEHAGPIQPGSTLRVPERRSYKTATWLSPLSTATAVVISIVALSRR